ncbi:hypothetical protein SAMN05216206_2760 [Pseudomonas guineae]|uniref:Uncharacterized protein n=1 Tax=Pseudomonas guineae TaxID=425504 RepID=A0A1I3KA33_9PSED|nr:hypothetical protein [Pseudomonas guineae]SFI69339.1 hypothetical protein SAMN05216206_2760 [Pseudomonas guineae]
MRLRQRKRVVARRKPVLTPEKVQAPTDDMPVALTYPIAKGAKPCAY